MPQAVTIPADTKQPELESIISRLYDLNNEYGNFLGVLEQKLHKILDKRSDKKEIGSSFPKSVEPDVITKLKDQCNSFYEHNLLFDKFLNHLEEII